MNPDIQPIAQFLVKHLVVVAALMVASLIVRRRSAAFRHSLWLIGFAWVALLPVLVVRLPHLSVERDVSDFSALGTNTLRSFRQPLPRLQDPTAPARPLTGPAALTAESAKPNTTLATPSTNVEPAPGNRFDWVRLALGIYVVGVFFCLVQVLTSLVAIAKSRNSSEPSSPETILELESAAQAVRLRRTPHLVVNARASVPMTFWMGRSVVVVPSNSVSRAVLLHECAHIRRGDWFAQVFARLLRSLFWFDPILLFAEQQMRAASEQAADDIVVSAGVQPVEYAEELFTIAAHSAGQRFDAGLAIVGTSNLKARIAQILRAGPRSIRVRFRWVAINALLGGLMVVPLAAIAYTQNDVPATNTGFISFGNGYWIRLLAVTEQDHSKTRSWTLDGELLPQPVCLEAGFGPGASGRQTYLIFATNIDDMTGLNLRRRDTASPHVGSSTSGLHSFTPQSSEDEHLGELEVKLPDSGTVDMLLTTPTTGVWTTYASACYDQRQMSSHVGPDIFPKTLDKNPKLFTNLEVPPSLSGQIQLQFLDADPVFGVMSENMDTAGGVSNPFRLFVPSGPTREVTLRTRQEPKTFMLTGIPVRPRSGSVMRAGPLPGVEFHDAVRNEFTLPDGEKLSMMSITAAGKGTWSPGDTPMTRDEVVPRPGEFGWESSDPETRNDQAFYMDNQPSLSDRVLHVTFSDRKTRRTRAPERFKLALFDAAGLRADLFYTDTTTSNSENLLYYVPEAVDSPPQDFVVRVADVAHATHSRLPLTAVFGDFVFKSGHDEYAKRLRPSHDIAVTRSPLLSSMYQDLNHVIEVNFLDAQGRPIETISHTNQGGLDTYTIARADPSKIKEVEAVSMPCTYVRFPKIAVNPVVGAQSPSGGHR